LLYGGQLGFNYQIDQFVFGAEGGWSNTVHIGWTVGAGIEYAVTDHIIAGVEYNYYGFSSETLSGGINPQTIPPRESVSTVVAKASYKF